MRVVNQLNKSMIILRVLINTITFRDVATEGVRIDE
jgi:hypothetical protein